MSISRKALAAAVKTRLDGTPHASVYAGQPLNPPTIAGDAEKRVAPYVAVYASAGTAHDDRRMSGTDPAIRWDVYLTIAAGYYDDALALLDRVIDRLEGWTPTVADVECSPLVPPPGYDPGPLHLDRDVTPNRWTVLLQYRTTATT